MVWKKKIAKGNMDKKRGRDEEEPKPTEKKQKSVVQQDAGQRFQALSPGSGGGGGAGFASYEGYRPQPLYQPPPPATMVVPPQQPGEEDEEEFDAEVAGLMGGMSLQ